MEYIDQLVADTLLSLSIAFACHDVFRQASNVLGPVGKEARSHTDRSSFGG